MAFGWSFPKLMLLVVLVFFLFGMPMMVFGMVLRDRKRRESRRE